MESKRKRTWVQKFLTGARAKKRGTAVLLTVCMAAAMTPQAAFAAVDPSYGLCEHHTQHDAGCGYVKTAAGHSCDHAHGPECYKDELICGYNEGEQQKASGSNAEHTHVQECHRLDCSHLRGEHDEDCHYVKSEAEHRCEYICEVCNGIKKDAKKEKTIVITEFEDLGKSVMIQQVPIGTVYDELNLPDRLYAKGYEADEQETQPEVIMIKDVDWELTKKGNSPTEYENGREQPCTYYFQPVLPDGYETGAETELPKIEIRYGWGYRTGGMGNGYSFDQDTGELTITSQDGMNAWVNTINKEDILSVKLKGSVTDIPKNKFQYWYQLQSVDMSECDELDIGMRAFLGCKGLTSIDFPRSISSMGKMIFDGCTALKTIDLSTCKTSIGESMFYGCAELESVTLHKDTKSIGKQAFENCKKLAKINLSECTNLEQIVNRAFYNCEALGSGLKSGSITLPSQIKSIGEFAFQSCQALKSISLSDCTNMTEIAKSTFNGCTGLQSVRLHDGITSIGVSAFDGCTALTRMSTFDGYTDAEPPSIDLSAGNGIARIENYAFRKCTSLTQVKLHDGITYIGQGSFDGCTALTRMGTFDGGTDPKPPSIDLSACQGISRIENYTFRKCTSLNNQVKLHDGITYIGQGAFEETALPSIDLSICENVTEIGATAFKKCASLTTAILPASLKKIGNQTFGICNNLKSLTFLGRTPPTKIASSLDDHIQYIYIPCSAEQSDPWSEWPTEKLVYGAALDELTVSGGSGDLTFTPDFFPGKYEYSLSVPNSVDSIKITPTVHGKGTVTVKGDIVVSGTASQAITLKAGMDIEIPITVKSAGMDDSTYTLTVKRAQDADATLKSLYLSAGDLAPSFDPSVTNYTVEVEYSTSSVTISAESNSEKASVSGTGKKLLNVGKNPFTITVTAENDDRKEYTVTITRKAPEADATLKSLSLSAGDLAPSFDPSVTNYTVEVGYSTSSVTINAGSTSKKASVSGTGEKLLNVGKNSFTITVTAESGDRKEYIVTITRKAPDADATLKSLSLSAGDLAPSFDPSVTKYTAVVENGTSSVTISAGSTSEKANVSGTGEKSLNVGENSCIITVTAESGDQKKYTVTITRKEAEADATLKSLSLSAGDLNPSFDPSVTKYTAVVENGTSSITISAESNSEKASVSGTGKKPLNVGENSFIITVTAENGGQKSYTVTITRKAAQSSGNDDDNDDDSASDNNSGSPGSGKKTTVTTEVKKDAAGNVTGTTATVTTDNILTTAGEGSSLITVSPDAASINSAAGAAGAAAGNPLEVLVRLPQETITGELQKPEVSSVAVDVLIPKAVSDNPNVEVGVSIGKESIQAAKDLGKGLSVTVRNENGAVDAVWSFSGQSMKNMPGQAADVNVSLHKAPIQSDDPAAQAVKPLAAAAGSENGLVLNIDGNGVLPETKLTVPATDQTGIKPGDSVTLYRFDQAANRLVPVPGAAYVVDANGNVTLDLPAKDFATGPDRYVLLPGAGTAAGGSTYQIKKGDTLNKIAREYGCTVEELLELNQVDVKDLQIGQIIQLPAR